MKIIESIRIKYFRSILNTTRGNLVHLPTSDLNVIVGSNDAGKSNYLKALSLFFNNSSEPNSQFSFWNDYSNQRHGVKKEENRIEIELIINPPRKQNFKNSAPVRWSKIWKGQSMRPEETITYLDGKLLSTDKRSAYYKWLKKIKFKYVPAIKSDLYFSNLMYDLYDVLQEDTYELEQAFNQQIREKTNLISQQLNSRLSIDSILQFKGSFRNLFHSLEFGSNDGRTMLSQKGDGVKVRHIPIILQNIAEAELRENRHREPIASTIWGFEEPENNLEFDSAKRLADTFLEYIDRVHFEDEDYSKFDEGIQIFLTTHSPIFYTLGNQNNNRISSFFVKKHSDESSNIRPITNEESIVIETEMKLQPLFELSKHWQTINVKIDNLEKKKLALEKEIESFSNKYKCIFLTEDKNQELLKTLLISNGFHLDEVDIRSYNGCTSIGSTQVLYQYLKDKFKDTCPAVVVHRDKDYLTPIEVQEEIKKFEKIGITLFVTEGTDIESYYVRIEHLKFCYPAIEEVDIDKIVKTAKEENKEMAINALRTKEYGTKHKHKNTHLGDALVRYYEANETLLFHGKKVLGKVKSLLQEFTRVNANIDIESPKLSDPVLDKISLELWKK